MLARLTCEQRYPTPGSPQSAGGSTHAWSTSERTECGRSSPGSAGAKNAEVRVSFVFEQHKKMWMRGGRSCRRKDCWTNRSETSMTQYQRNQARGNLCRAENQVAYASMNFTQPIAKRRVGLLGGCADVCGQLRYKPRTSTQHALCGIMILSNSILANLSKAQVLCSSRLSPVLSASLLLL